MQQLKGFPRPKRLESDSSTLTNYYGKFFADPFERGFGITIGNALRRTLLSALSGAAITSVKIDGIYHEFSTIPGVVEDCTDIILSIKGVRFKLYVDHPKTIYIKASGSGEVKAGDIITDADVEVLNPDLHIATLDSDASLEIEMTIEKGRGYVPAELNKKEDQPLGVIPIDAFFSPIRKVKFAVEDVLMAARSCDRLILEVWTDGSIVPEDAIAQAAKVLKDHWAIFIKYEDKEEEEEVVVDESQVKLYENMNRSVSELELSVRSYNCLKNASIETIRDLVQKTDAEMLKTKNFGRKSLNEIKEILTKMGLSLGFKPDECSLTEASEEQESDNASS